RLSFASALVNSLYSFAWDVRMDWGLGQPRAKKWGLRNTLLVSRDASWPYYIAVAVDLVLRLAWLPVRLGERKLDDTIDLALMLGVLEVTRRSMWNVFRLEWECIQCLGGKEAL
ncbi:unnamed protein product, partial [Discosporangium mesarthrocarpum]